MPSHELFVRTVEHYLAPIKAYLDDSGVTEVMINRADDIYIEKDGKVVKTDARFADQEAYEAAINNILQFTGRSLSDDQPLVDSRLPDGSRVHVAKAPCARNGTSVAIRKFSPMVLDIDWLIELGTLTAQARDFLSLAVNAEQNMLVAGGTSSGKTSLLNALSSFIPNDQRIVVIEDSAELQLQKNHLISLEAQQPDRYGRGEVTIRELFKSSLRLRPDRIIIGEVRGGEALDMIQAMTSGHGGSMGTLHANSSADTLTRLETMAMMSEVDLPLFALRSQIASAVDLVVHMSRHIGGRRVVTQISEVDRVSDSGQYTLRDLFVLKADDSDKPENQVQLTWTGERSAMGTRLSGQHLELVTDPIKPILGMD